jgi:hypothetical protein
MLKTRQLALGAGAVAAVAGSSVAMVAGGALALTGVALAVAALLPLAVGASGAIVLHRVDRVERGETDLFLQSNEPRLASSLERHDGFRAGPLRRLAGRMMLGHDFLVGDEVEIKSLEEIQATLDENGCLGGMPFMPEMVAFCGRRGRVFRSVDKIYDYGRTRLMRRLPGCVLVSGLRCDGEPHGGCQARCYVIWRTEWLRRPGDAQSAVGQGSVAPARVPSQAPDGTPRERYFCQYTELHAASTPMGPWGIGKELRPLVAGNVTLQTWIVGLATRLFNRVQGLRGGAGFPDRPRLKGLPAIEPEPLVPGDKVIVRPIIEIESTLNDKGKHRGLWFDPDQIKHCGKPRTVIARVHKIIDDAYGQMLTMKTPCILLEDVDYSGETLSFSAQHDLYFWREHWLHKQG